MALANILRDRVQIQKRVAVATALGETVVWTHVTEKYARVVPLDAKARSVYQQMNSEVTHKVVMRGAVSLPLGVNRLLWGNATLEPVEPTQSIGGNTVVMVKEA